MPDLKSQPLSEQLTDNFLNIMTNFGHRVALKDHNGALVKYSSIINLCNTKTFSKTKRKLTFCVVDNDLGGISGYLALLAGQSVPLMLNASINKSQLQQLIELYRPKYVWSSEAKSQKIEEASCILRFRGYCLMELQMLTLKSTNRWRYY